jgi:hypothetical protein
VRMWDQYQQEYFTLYANISTTKLGILVRLLMFS